MEMEELHTLYNLNLALRAVAKTPIASRTRRLSTLIWSRTRGALMRHCLEGGVNLTAVLVLGEFDIISFLLRDRG